MSNKITYVCVALIAAGCSTPLGKFNKQKDVVTGISQNIDKNKEKEIETAELLYTLQIKRYKKIRLLQNIHK